MIHFIIATLTPDVTTLVVRELTSGIQPPKTQNFGIL